MRGIHRHIPVSSSLTSVFLPTTSQWYSHIRFRTTSQWYSHIVLALFTTHPVTSCMGVTIPFFQCASNLPLSAFVTEQNLVFPNAQNTLLWRLGNFESHAPLWGFFSIQFLGLCCTYSQTYIGCSSSPVLVPGAVWSPFPPVSLILPWLGWCSRYPT